MWLDSDKNEFMPEKSARLETFIRRTDCHTDRYNWMLQHLSQHG